MRKKDLDAYFLFSAAIARGTNEQHRRLRKSKLMKFQFFTSFRWLSRAAFSIPFNIFFHFSQSNNERAEKCLPACRSPSPHLIVRSEKRRWISINENELTQLGCGEEFWFLFYLKNLFLLFLVVRASQSSVFTSHIRELCKKIFKTRCWPQQHSKNVECRRRIPLRISPQKQRKATQYNKTSSRLTSQ